MPVSAINRPLPSTLDNSKVQQFVQDMQAGAVFTPIEVAWVQDNGDNYYFAFGGCHRWAAVQQLGLPTIRARLIRVSPSSIDTYLGASSPFRRRRQQQQQQQQQAQQEAQQNGQQQHREQEELRRQLSQNCSISECLPVR
ncbi:hypothetical protein OEZ86_002389 [Tetradesmus obliquus]|nr:hypothetical protein OEZ86_002389 [Tetradesmus obliquus]